MSRVKGGTVAHARHKKYIKQAKGYFGSKHKLYKTAKEQVSHSLRYAYRDRRSKKRDFRKLWITRINAACRENGISYSKFINGLKKANVEIDRKVLSELAILDSKAFTSLVNVSKAALEGKESSKVKIEVATEKKVTEKKEVSKEEKKETKKEEKKETKKEVKTDVKDYSKLTVAELKKIAKEKKIEGYSTMKKDELLKALK